MRKLKDKSGFETWVEFVRGESAFAGLLEGSPYLARQMRLSSGRQNMRQPGCYFHGLEEIEQELATLPRDHTIWPQNERWSAKLVTSTNWQSRCREFLVVHWFQQDDDPMQRLSDIMAGVEFREYCRMEPHGLDD